MLFTNVIFNRSIFALNSLKCMEDGYNYSKIKVEKIRGRYINNAHIYGFINDLKGSCKLEMLGESVDKNPIYVINVGQGPNRILMWSQMHGNESTTTKAVIDLLHFLNNGTTLANDLLSKVTLKIIPILNPDGAIAYTRVNANNMDLNRDALNLTQPESRFLRAVFNDFRPHFCFNLHDQRTIFNVGDSNKPATVSFLAPAFDEELNTSPTREMAMRIIVAMNQALQKIIPGQVGRFDDSFNPNCVGDSFQMEKVPTILFEAGHYQEDYQREKTREFICTALYKAMYTIGNDETENYELDKYLEIPENKKLFFDIIIENANILDSDLGENECLGILFKETLQHDKIVFIPEIAEKGFKPNSFFGHKIVDCLKEEDLNWLRRERVLESMD